MDINNINNSNIVRPINNELENLDMQIKNQINIDQLQKENLELIEIVNKYNKILKEYQNKYGKELFTQLEKELIYSDEENEDILYKKKLLEIFPIFREYEKEITKKKIENDFILEEKDKLEKEKQSILKENLDLKSEIEKLQKQNDELYNDLQERIRAKENKKRYIKTFSNNINNIEEINSEKEIIEQGQSNLNFNINTNSNMAMMYNTMKENYNNLLNKEKMDYKQKIENEEIITKLKNDNEILSNQANALKSRLNEAYQDMSKLTNDLNSRQGVIDGLKINMPALKEEINKYKEAYNSLETRKNN